MDAKNTNAAAVSGAAGAAPTNDQPEQKTELTLSSAADISAQIELMRRNAETGPGALSKRKGLTRTAALDGMSTPFLVLLAAAAVRQLAINCGEDTKEFNRQIKLLNEYSKAVPNDIANEQRLDKYAAFADEFGVTRNEGESADSFISRIQDAIVKSRK